MSLMGDIRAEQAAVRTTELLHAAYGVAYAVLSDELTIKWHSPGLSELVGAEETDLTNQTLADSFWEFVGADELLIACLKGRSEGFILDNVNREAADGTLRYLTFRIAPLSPNVTGSGLLLVVEDTTEIGRLQQNLVQERNELRLARNELSQANEELQQLNRLKSLFLSMAAHDLRTPLAVIRGFAELLNEDIPAQAGEQKEFVEIIFSQSERLRRMVDNLLDMDQIERGQLVITRRSCALDEVVTETVALLKPMARLRQQRIVLSLPDEPLLIEVDPHRMAQIVYNLVGNALKFTPDEGLIEVRLDKSEGQARLVVADNGPGMSPEDLSHIFTVYYRTPEARRSKATGSGLGLYIVKSLVEAHQGQVSVESELGQGTTFKVNLPLDAVKSKESHAG